jgi:hypothetical protein
VIEQDDPDRIVHDEWKYKSLLTVRKYLEHKNNYEKKVRNFFQRNDSSRLLQIDVTDRATQETELKRFLSFIGVGADKSIEIPHSNKTRSQDNLPQKLLDFIDETIAVLYADEGEKI